MQVVLAQLHCTPFPPPLRESQFIWRWKALRARGLQQQQSNLRPRRCQSLLCVATATAICHRKIISRGAEEENVGKLRSTAKGEGYRGGLFQDLQIMILISESIPMLQKKGQMHKESFFLNRKWPTSKKGECFMMLSTQLWGSAVRACGAKRNAVISPLINLSYCV